MENTKELWDDLWSGDSKSLQEHKFNLAIEENGTVWRGIKETIEGQFNNISQLHVVELGAGCGCYSALMAKMVHKVTMIDYSDSAISKSKEFYEFLGISNIEYIKADALSLPKDLYKKYDISMSFGLAEHFRNNDRKSIIKSHFDLLKKKGISFISVPNLHCFPYRLWKSKREISSRWHFGLEIPFSRNELKSICKELNINQYHFIGSSFISSFNFILPFNSWKKSIGKRIVPDYFQKLDRIKPTRATPLDSFLGYALVLCGKKE